MWFSATYKRSITFFELCYSASLPTLSSKFSPQSARIFCSLAALLNDQQSRSLSYITNLAFWLWIFNYSQLLLLFLIPYYLFLPNTIPIQQPFNSAGVIPLMKFWSVTASFICITDYQDQITAEWCGKANWLMNSVKSGFQIIPVLLMPFSCSQAMKVRHV